MMLKVVFRELVGPKLTSLYCEVNESLKPYGVTNHRHTPEIEEQLGLAINKEPITISLLPLSSDEPRYFSFPLCNC